MEMMANAWIPSAWQLLLGAALIASLVAVLLIAVFAKWGSYWLQAYMSGADVSMKSLIVMSFLRIEHRLIVTAKVMGRQAGLRRLCVLCVKNCSLFHAKTAKLFAEVAKNKIKTVNLPQLR